MNVIKYLAMLPALSLLTGCIVVAKPSTANVNLKRELSVTTHDLQKLDIDAGAGELRVLGSESASEISVKADIYTVRGEGEQFELTLNTSGETAYLVAKNNSSGFWVGNSPRIDLVVTVPTRLNLNIEDGSGDLWIKNINGIVNLDDASGSATLSSLGSDVVIEDGSGALNVSNVKGKLSIDDASGDLHVDQVNSDTEIEDGSGSLSATNIEGNLSIVDASGDMTVRAIKGIVVIEDGSGHLKVADVNGNVTIDDASGDMVVRDIIGTVNVNDGSGDIDIEKAGALEIIEAGSGDLRVRQVKGGFDIGH